MNRATTDSGLRIHQILADSYLLYLGAVLVGFALDRLFPVRFEFPFLQPFGALLIVFGTVVILWSQRASHKSGKLRSSEKVCRDHFCVGPYVFTRTPTQYGLSFLVLGLAFLYGSFFMIIASAAAFLLSRFILVPRQEKHLANKYGEAYLEYKRHVKL